MTAPAEIFSSDDPRPIHFVGIGGAGMSALAELCVRRGINVTGCDVHPSGASDLVALGVQVWSEHNPNHVDGVRAVVYSSAIPLDVPELERARSLGLPVVRRAEALAGAIAGGEVVAIAGTHGKSTTTVMTTEALASAGLDPTGLVGARVTAWKGNLRRGSASCYVVEADEYDRSFLALNPEVAVITNVEADHLDIYHDIDDIRDAFSTFIARAPHIVLCADDMGAASLTVPASANVIRYGLDAEDVRLTARDVRTDGDGSAFSVWLDGKLAGEARLRVVGLHNVRNALAAIAAGVALGRSFEDLAPGLAAMKGVERRFQRIGDARGISIVDDYAHHPTEIRATLAAARRAFPGRRIVIAFQPHLFSRTRDFAAEFGRELAAADVVFIADIYAAREEPIGGVTSALVVDAVRREGGAVLWSGAQPDLAKAVAGAARDGDVILTVGAGDITNSAKAILALLVRNEERGARNEK